MKGCSLYGVVFFGSDIAVVNDFFKMIIINSRPLLFVGFSDLTM